VETFLGYNVLWFFPVAGLFEITGPSYLVLRWYFFCLLHRFRTAHLLRRPWIHPECMVFGDTGGDGHPRAGNVVPELHAISGNYECVPSHPGICDEEAITMGVSCVDAGPQGWGLGSRSSSGSISESSAP